MNFEKQVHIPIILILLLAFILRFYNVLIDGMSFFREGTWGMSAWRIIEGDIPYRDFFHAHPPLSPYLLAAIFLIFGVGVIQARLFVISVTVIACFMVYLSGKKIDTKTGLMGSLIFAVTPLSIQYGMAAVNDFVAVTFCVVGYYFLISPIKQETVRDITPNTERITLILGGIFVGLGFLVKTLLVLFFLSYIIFIIIEGLIQKIAIRDQIKKICFFIFGFLCSILPVMVLFYGIAGDQFIWQVFGQHMDKPARPILGRYHNIPIALTYLIENNFVFFVIFLISVPFAVRTSYGRVLLISICILIGSIILVIPRQYPNYYHAAIPFMAMVSGFFPFDIPKSFRFKRETLISKETVKVGLIIFLIAFISIATVSYPPLNENEKLAIEWIKSNTAVDDYILSDNLNINFRTLRRSPFAEISIDRTRLGQLNGEMLINASYEFDIRVVVNTGRLFEEYGTYEVFLMFLEENYSKIHEGYTIYYRLHDFPSPLYGDLVTE